MRNPIAKRVALYASIAAATTNAEPSGRCAGTPGGRSAGGLARHMQQGVTTKKTSPQYASHVDRGVGPARNVRELVGAIAQRRRERKDGQHEGARADDERKMSAPRKRTNDVGERRGEHHVADDGKPERGARGVDLGEAIVEGRREQQREVRGRPDEPRDDERRRRLLSPLERRDVHEEMCRPRCTAGAGPCSQVCGRLHHL